MSMVKDILMTHLPANSRTTPSGWISFSGPCCIHNGESQDTKRRAGVIILGDGLSFSCFNCGFKASWQPGRNMSFKMRKLLQWFGVSDDAISKIALDMLRITEGIQTQNDVIKTPEFHTVHLVEGAQLIDDTPTDNKYLQQVKQYMQSRDMSIGGDYEYYWSPNTAYRDRVIIPFKHNNRIVGWTARKVTPGNPRYLMNTQPGYVYGMDQQTQDRDFVIVCEGVIDAQYISGCSLMGSEVSEQQELLINSLRRDVILVPDRDTRGKALMNQALALGWGVSMPEWPRDCKDIGDVVQRHGKLYTLYSIVNSAETSNLKIKLRSKRWFN